MIIDADTHISPTGEDECSQPDALMDFARTWGKHRAIFDGLRYPHNLCSQQITGSPSA